MDAGLRPDAIDGVIIFTCTGYLCPGLASYVAERIDLRSDVIALDLGSAPDGWWWVSSFGAGFSCHGALLRVSGNQRGAINQER